MARPAGWQPFCARFFRPDRFEKTPGDAGENAGAIAGVRCHRHKPTAVLSMQPERLQGLQQQAHGRQHHPTGPEKPTPQASFSPANSRRCRACRNGAKRGREECGMDAEQPAEKRRQP